MTSTRLAPPSALSVRCGLENAELRGSWAGLDKCQPCALEQVSILTLGTFSAAGEYQHRGVQAGGLRASRAFWDNDLYEQDFAGRGHCCSAVCQDFDRRLVVPVMDDPLQKVGIPIMWHGFGEVTCHHFGATGGDVPVDGPVGRLHNLCEIEEHSQGTWVAVKDRRQQRTMSAADVNDPSVAREVV